jgi:Na+/H+ antiporter NhaD/arsenite permease-like protein
MGVGALLFVPVFKTLTHLPPYMGMLFGLGVLWVTTELMHKSKPLHDKRKLTIVGVLQKVDVPTIFFFLGILTAVASLQSAGHLGLLASYLDEHLHNIYAINLIIGLLSAIVDNVPLVAGAMGMYDIAPVGSTGYMAHFMVDGIFWEFLAYCAGTGGSILIIGSAAGVAAMGMEKIDFIWYLKKISLLALIGYLAGAATYYVQALILHSF